MHAPRLAAVALASLFVAAAFAGCLGREAAAIESLVPYPRLGDVAVYETKGAHVQFARWENAHPFVANGGVRYTISESDAVIDGARAIHQAFRVQLDVNNGGGFVKHADLFVSPRHQSVVQSFYPLTQDQAVVAFDERGFPWLFGASALFGEDLAREETLPFHLPDNLGRGQELRYAWRIVGEEKVDGVEMTRLDLEGPSTLTGSLWMAKGAPYPVKVVLSLHDAGLAPHVRADAAVPATLEARLVDVQRGERSVPPRERSAGYASDEAATRLRWDGEKPPDGAPGYVPYLLEDAVRDAKLIDRPFAQWLATADDPRLYRATFQEVAGPVDGLQVDQWLLQFVDRSQAYYQVEMERVSVTLIEQGAPRVNRSAPAEPPADKNHGWFAHTDAPERLVPLSEGVRIVRDVFGAQGIQIFLRSFSDPAGYSYFIDGGFESPGGRYTVVYHPGTGFIEQSTGPMTPRYARI